MSSMRSRSVGSLIEKTFSPDHPSLALPLSNLALIYQAQQKNADAEPLLRRSLAITEKAFGPEHPSLPGPLSVRSKTC